jgi:tryptophan synthase alpha chain
MSKISEIFKNKKCLITYLTAGDPHLDKTAEYIRVMSQNGADLIEIGIPFSDPTAEGEVIQSAMDRALRNNTTIDGIFSMLSSLNDGKKNILINGPLNRCEHKENVSGRDDVLTSFHTTQRVCEANTVPLVFMAYINSVFSYGYDKFFKKCKETGISGIIIPDMPFEEQEEIRRQTSEYGVEIITLIAPTSNERIEMLAKKAEGFIYLVSSLGVTGVRAKITTDIEKIVSSIKKVTETPVAVGFGISTPEQVKEMTLYADGAIVGSAIVKIIAEHGENAARPLAQYVASLKNGLNGRN